MHQYEFSMIKGKNHYTVFCTAKSVENALTAVKGIYAPEFTIKASPICKYPAHFIYGEVNAI